MPDKAVWLEVVVDDGAPVPFLANMYRPDLAEAGFGHGCFGFKLHFPTPLDPRRAHSLVVRRQGDHVLLKNAPWPLLRAPSAASEARTSFEAAISAEIEAVGTGAEIEPTLRFMLRQVERMMHCMAHTETGTVALHRFRLRWSDFLEGERAPFVTPDLRPWALVIETAISASVTQGPSDTQGPGRNLVSALQAMGYRVAVVGSQCLDTDADTLQKFHDENVTVLGAPMYFTTEDVLRRHQALFRVVVLCTPLITAAYALLCRIHQPRARIVAVLGTPLGDPLRDRLSPIFTLSGALAADGALVETEAAAEMLRAQLPGRSVGVLAPSAKREEGVAVLAALGVVSTGCTPASQPLIPQSV